ncbi:unnamed protein product [Cylindrotheca closterium]|uniref:Uncharacterized protein n=1 Tax=Cylindrotheca closterium TaxID=2856 RepID=A0AAD2CPX7_9STRA|nr:unnamed protein product [Cylindrotheca closterium]
MRILDYQYGAPDMHESKPQPVTPDETSSSSSSARVEDRGETTLPLHHQVQATQRMGTETCVPYILVTPTKSASSRVEASQNTPITTASLDDESLESSVLPSPSPRHTDQLNADHVRFSVNYLNLQHLSPTNIQLEKHKIEVVLETFIPKLVLEVMGGAGAVWGFSEAIGLRTSMNAWFWRPVTLFAGSLFFIRWYRQVKEFSRLYDLRHKRRSTVEGETAHLLWQENV